MPKPKHARRAVEHLETRTHLSVTCTCAACTGAAAKMSASDGEQFTAAHLAALQSGAAEAALNTLAAPAGKALRAAKAALYSAVDSIGLARNDASVRVRATSAAPFAVDLAGMKATLATAPKEFTIDHAVSGLTLALPTPDGSFERFEVVETSVMSAGLAAEFPEFKSYRGVGVDNPARSAVLDVSPQGFHGMVIAPEGKSYLIDPAWLHDATGTYVSYYKADAVRQPGTEAWQCTLGETEAEHAAHADLAADVLADGDPGAPLPITYGTTLVTYRAAFAASGEYTQFHGGTVAAGQNAVATSIVRVSGVYETELAIRLSLVANNASVIYTNAATDPYSNSSTNFTQNQSNLNTVIGFANYDIGHVYTTGSGGVAGLGVVGKSNKAYGTTGSGAPIGDAFWIDYVAHEVGHQFGANHSFNAGNTGQRNANTAYEPGSGVTIMGYAGITGSEDTAFNSIPFFHSVSIDEIRNYIATIPAVGTQTSLNNAAPVVGALTGYTIPVNTPFQLTASATDANPTDVLTYDWQERALGAVRNLAQADVGSGPLFINITPTQSGTRSLPRLGTVLAGQSNTTGVGGNGPIERLPTVARASYPWRVVVRDGRGGVTTADVTHAVSTVGGGGFAVTSNNTAGGSFSGGAALPLTWNVVGTNAAPYNAANVRVLLSTNGGVSFDTVLAESTANDGSETVTLPSVGTNTQARVKIEAINNVFYDVNNANFTLTPSGTPTPGNADLITTSDSGLSASDNLTNRDNSSPASALSFTVANTVAGATVRVLIDGVVRGTQTATGTTTTVTTAGDFDLADGAHAVTVTQQQGTGAAVASAGALGITVDTVAPALVAGSPAFLFEAAPQRVRLNFSEPLNTAPTNGAFAVQNVSTGTFIPNFIDTAGQTATQTTVLFNDALATGALPDGNYQLTFSFGFFEDAAGNAPATSPVLFDFFVLAGDANRDRSVNFADLSVLALNYGQTGRTFSQGNFDYDASGLVGFGDLSALAVRYGTTLAPARPGAAANGGTRVARDVLA